MRMNDRNFWHDLTSSMSGNEKGDENMGITIKKYVKGWHGRFGGMVDYYAVCSDTETRNHPKNTRSEYVFVSGGEAASRKKAEEIARRTGEDITHEVYEEEWVKKNENDE